jgi:hypothetical protein
MGCEAANESEASRAKSLGDSGLPTAKGDPNASAPPKSQEDWFKSKGDPYKSAGYPGTPRKK